MISASTVSTKTLLSSAAVSAALLMVLACRNDPAGEEIRFQGSTMGTYYTVKIVPDDAITVARERLYDEIRSTLDAVDDAMSTYKSDSELTRFNQAESEQPFPLSKDTAFVFERAREVHHRSGGAFDITVGPLVDAWGFGPPGRITTAPPRDLIETLRETTGQNHLTLDSARSTIRKDRAEVHADLSAIAKGFGVDQVARMLKKKGFRDFMVEVGGEVRVSGLNLASKPWRVAIERPESDAKTYHRVLELSDIALATSGDYRNFIDIDGRRISHTIDPRTGYPVKHETASVTVLHDECIMADAWATALTVLGPEEGMQLAESEDLAVIMLIHDGENAFKERLSSSMRELLKASAAPARPEER